MDSSLRARLQTDLKAAMIARDEVNRDTIRYVLSELKNAEIEERGPLSPEQEIVLLNRVNKRLIDAIEQYDAAGRTDLADKERGQQEIVKRYLPTELTDDELSAQISAAIAETGAARPKDMGKVMQVLLPRIAGAADGKRVSAAVRSALQG